MNKDTSWFDKLRHFIGAGMRMSHVYQPVMLRELLRNGGCATRRQIASALLAEDQSQLEYYDQIVQKMVGRVLKDRGVVEQHGKDYQLSGWSELSSEQTKELIELCEQKLSAYLAGRSDPWSHRRKSEGYVSGTLRYEVLKRAKFRCELCGISADEKALEVDHILPRTRGGSDEHYNLQALCFSCNAMKRDRDDERFTGTRELYDFRDEVCIFCKLSPNDILLENELAIAMRDRYPVTPLHTLIIPKRHVTSYFELFQPERNAMERLVQECRSSILTEDALVTGFNIGANDGVNAGQTVMHCHLHLIPRRQGDVDRPMGGVRGVIPQRQNY
jgi:diadenosine tetraphosphate (Ap4A) HIT family hydrolase